MDIKIISDMALAENCKRLMARRSEENLGVDVEIYVYNNVRYITFTAMGAKQFKAQYSVLSMFADMLGVNCDNYANPHFIDGWKQHKQAVASAIMDDTRMPVCITGHGVAGAVAMIAGYDLIKMHAINICKVVTFGAPRSLNYKKKNNHFKYLMCQIATNYVLPCDKFAKTFRWSNYYSVGNVAVENDNVLIPNRNIGSIENYIYAVKSK